jgi:hypothetical protein
MKALQIGKYVIPEWTSFKLPNDVGNEAFGRRGVYVVLAALFVTDSDGTLDTEGFDQALPYSIGGGEWALSYVYDLRELGYIEPSRYHDAHLKLATEKECAESQVWRDAQMRQGKSLGCWRRKLSQVS